MIDDDKFAVYYMWEIKSISSANSYRRRWNQGQWGLWNLREFSKLCPWICRENGHILQKLAVKLHTFHVN